MFPMRLWIVLVVLFVLGAAGCSDDEPLAATPTSTHQLPPEATATVRPQPSATPNSGPIIQREAGWGAVDGPVLVYKRSAAPSVLVAYDVGRARPVWSAKMHQDDGFVEAAIGKAGVVLTTETSAYFQDFRGGALEKLFDLDKGSFDLGGAAAAPDGVTLAFSVQGAPEPIGTPMPDGSQMMGRRGSILFYDLASRSKLMEVRGTPEHALAAGAVAWRADGRGVNLHSFTHSESPGGRSAVFLDGSVAAYDVTGWAYLAPDGLRMIHGITSECMHIGGPDMYLRDLDSGIDVYALHNSEREFTGLS
jgi:hypothetical protein